MISWKLSRALMIGVCPLAISSAAFAQATTPETADSPNTADIIVTAQNRAQSVQDVPIAMTVLSGEGLLDAGVTDLATLNRLAPDLQITTDTTLTRITLRGVGTNSNNETQDQSVSVNIDGEYINSPTTINSSLFDIDRVEVLRGPQGTLYGRNATGGAVNFITRRPGDTLGVNLSASYGNYNQVTIDGGADLPVGPGLSFRIAGMYANNEGYVYHPNIDARSNDQGIKAGRLSMLAEPAEGLEIYLAGEYVRIEQGTGNQAFVNLNTAPNRANENGPGCTGAGYIEVAPLVAGVQCVPQNTSFLKQINRGSYAAPATGNGTFDSEQIAVRGQLSYDFGPAMLTYRGGYRDAKSPSVTTLAPSYRFINFKFDTQTQSHELRLNGGSDGGLVWQGGVFYFREKQEIERGLFNTVVGPNGSFINYFRRPYVISESKAAFAQVDIPLGEQLTAVAGIRYTDDKRTARFENFNALAFNSGPGRRTGPAPVNLNLRQDNNKVTWLAGLNYEPSPSSLFYAKASSGYKSGGFDAVGSFKPETVTAYEIGTKNTFGGGRYTFNAGAFYYDYKDLQVSVLIDSTLGGQIFNAGKARTWGIEAQFDAHITDNDRFTVSANYLNAEYGSLLASIPVQCVGCGLNAVGDLDGISGDPVVQPNLAGNTPPRSPKITLTAGYSHIWKLGSGGAITADVNTRFNSGYFTTIFNYNDDKQRGFSQTDASLKYETDDEMFSIQAFVRNIENIRPIVYGSFTSAGPDDVFVWSFGAPRTYGVRIGFKY